MKSLTQKTIVLLAVSTSIFFEALDIAIVNLAMPLIKADFNLSSESVQWIQTLYVLFYGGFLILGGKLADVKGRKLIFMIGSSIFLITSLGAALSNSLIMLSSFRAIQGLGAAFVMPAAFSIVTTTFTQPAERNWALGIFGSFAALGSGSGLSIGGIIATYFGWPWVFYINVPVILVSMIVGYYFIESDRSKHSSKKLDYLTGVLLTSGIVILTFIIHEVKNIEENVVLIASLFIVMIGCGYFVIKRSSSPNALIDFSIFNNKSTLIANGVVFLMGAFFTSYLFLISIVFQSYMNYSAAKAGLILVPFSVMSALVAKSLLPRLLKRISIYAGAALGMALMTSGGAMLLMATLSDFNIFFILISIACVTGTGIAVCFTTLNVIGVSDIPPSHHGLAASFINTSFFFGGGVGLSLLSVFISDSNPVMPAVVLTCYAFPGVIILLPKAFRKILAA
jgi:EmrB/QacA subfamily drug resistance transporter